MKRDASFLTQLLNIKGMVESFVGSFLTIAHLKSNRPVHK